jgi:hypothetical protein
MSDRKIIKRIGANMLDIELKHYDEIAADQNKMFSAIQSFRQRRFTPIGRLFVKEYPTSNATVIDIENYLKQLQDTHNIKIDVLVVDYINILKNYRCRDASNTYINITHLAEDLRALAVKYELLVITATQINRSGFDTSDITVANMSESTGLLNTADQGYGIIQDASMRLDREYALKILKSRDGYGKNSRMFLDIDYSKMRLVENGMVLDEQGNDINLRNQVASVTNDTKRINPAKVGNKNMAERYDVNDNGFSMNSGNNDDILKNARPDDIDIDIENLNF